MAQRRKNSEGPLKVTIDLDNEMNVVVEALAKAAHMDKKWFIVSVLEKHLREQSQTERSAQVG